MALFRRSRRPTPRKILRVGLLNPYRAQDPRRSQDVVSVMVQAQIFEPPYEPFQGGREPVPQLFTEPLTVESSRDGRQVFSARWRPDLRFSDGRTVRATDAVTSLGASEVLAEQADVEADGDRLRFVLTRPNRRFDLVLSQSFCSIVGGPEGRYVGTGPFMETEESSPGVVRLVRNPHYRGAVALDEIHFTHYPLDGDGHPAALLEAVERGEVDFTNALSRDHVTRLTNVRKQFQPGSSTAILFLNCERPFFAHAGTRRAIDSSIDRGAMTRLFFENALAFTASSVLPPAMGSWRPPRTEWSRSGEETRGVPDRLRMLIVWGPRTYSPHPTRLAKELDRQLQAELGVRLDVDQPEDASSFYERLTEAEYDLVLAGWIADTPDPADFLEVLLSSRRIPVADSSPVVRANMSRWRSPAFESLLEAYRDAPRSETMSSIVDLVAREAPLVPLFYGPSLAVCSWRIADFEAPPVGVPLFSGIDVEAEDAG